MTNLCDTALDDNFLLKMTAHQINRTLAELGDMNRANTHKAKEPLMTAGSRSTASTHGLQFQEKDDEATSPISFDPDSVKSEDIIARTFVSSRGLVVISGKGIILAETESAGRSEFVKLMETLRGLDEKIPVLAPTKRTLTWIIDTAGRAASRSAAKREIMLLQACLKETKGETRQWLVKRAFFAIANAEPAWVMNKVAHLGLSPNKYRSSKNKRDAGRFFRTFRRRPWAKNGAFTAFLPIRDGDQPTYFSYKLADESSSPKGESRRSISVVRNGYIDRFNGILRLEKPNDLEQHNVNKLFEDGFLFLSFEEFIEMNIE